MIQLNIGGAGVRVDRGALLGEGGEACVYDLGNGQVVKVYRKPNDPMYANDAAAQRAAGDRLALAQKKLREFPRGLPARMVAPVELAYDTGGKVAGYTMPLLRGGEVLFSFAQPKFRRTSGVGQNALVPVLRDLRSTVDAIHKRGVVIGDFNDLNVLVRGEEAHVIDADSAQFGPYLCRTYTTRFVDPLVCEAGASGAPELARPHTTDTDWYAFTAMAVELFLLVDPYGGVYAPTKGPKVQHAARPMARIPVWHPEVRYPRLALPIDRLPVELLERFHQVFERDARGAFPAPLLDNIRWTTCSSCGTEHARPVCPHQGCQTAAPAVKPVTTTVQVRGTVTATSVYRGGGRVLRAEAHGGRLLWLVHEGGKLRREDGSVVVDGGPLPGMRFRVVSKGTYLSNGSTTVQLSPGERPKTFHVATIGSAPILGANDAHTYWCDGDGLFRDETMTSLLAGAPDRIGSVVAGLTRFWVGDRMGFGFARDQGLTIAFTFDADARGIRDGLPIQIRGTLLDATCAIAGDRAWFLTKTKEGPRIVNRCWLVRSTGAVEAAAEAEDGDDSWLGGIRGVCAVGDMLFVPTDAGAVRVEVVRATSGTAAATAMGAILATKTFPDTEPWVNRGCQLLMAGGGLCVVNEGRTEITRLVIR